jgi:hypothetical protein
MARSALYSCQKETSGYPEQDGEEMGEVREELAPHGSAAPLLDDVEAFGLEAACGLCGREPFRSGGQEIENPCLRDRIYLIVQRPTFDPQKIYIYLQ